MSAEWRKGSLIIFKVNSLPSTVLGSISFHVNSNTGQERVKQREQCYLLACECLLSIILKGHYVKKKKVSKSIRKIPSPPPFYPSHILQKGKTEKEEGQPKEESKYLQTLLLGGISGE